jgi:hypothetical protein
MHIISALEKTNLRPSSKVLWMYLVAISEPFDDVYLHTHRARLLLWRALSMNPRTFYRAFKQLRQEGYVKVDKHQQDIHVKRISLA